jgi:hypothetical protein
LGNFYTNFVIIGRPQPEVLEAVRDMAREAYVVGGPQGDSVVFDEQCDTQDTDEIERLGTTLCERFKTPVIAAMNHDDGHLLLWLFRSGQVARYQSCRDAVSFAWELSRVRGGIIVFPLLAAALGWPIVIFQLFRHWIVAQLLAVPIMTVGFGYRYISEGEIPPGISEDDVRNA